MNNATQTYKHVRSIQTRILRLNRQAVADRADIHLNTVVRFLKHGNITITTLGDIEHACTYLENLP